MYKTGSIIKKMTIETRRRIRPILFFTGLFIINSFAWILTVALDLKIDEMVRATTSILIIGLFIIGTRYPGILQIIQGEAKRISYARSHLSWIDVDRVLDRMNFLMEEEKIFRDEGISISKFAADAQVTPPPDVRDTEYTPHEELPDLYK